MKILANELGVIPGWGEIAVEAVRNRLNLFSDNYAKRSNTFLVGGCMYVFIL